MGTGVKGVKIKNKLPISGEMDTPPGDSYDRAEDAMDYGKDLMVQEITGNSTSSFPANLS